MLVDDHCHAPVMASTTVNIIITIITTSRYDYWCYYHRRCRRRHRRHFDQYRSQFID